MALAIDPHHGSVRVDHRHRVEQRVVRALVHADRQHHAQFTRHATEVFDRRVAFDRERPLQIVSRLVLAEVVTLEQFRNQDDLSTLFRRFANESLSSGHVGGDVLSHRHLNGGENHPQSTLSMAATTSGASGAVFGWNRATTLPARSTTNFSKFQRMSPLYPSPSFASFNSRYSGCW